MTPQELESRCRAVGCWPEGLTIRAPSGDWYRYTGFVNPDEAEAFILAELWAKMPKDYGVFRPPDFDNDFGAYSWSNRLNTFGWLGSFDTPLEAALACHEHAKGIR